MRLLSYHSCFHVTMRFELNFIELFSEQGTPRSTNQHSDQHKRPSSKASKCSKESKNTIDAFIESDEKVSIVTSEAKVEELTPLEQIIRNKTQSCSDSLLAANIESGTTRKLSSSSSSTALSEISLKKRMADNYQNYRNLKFTCNRGNRKLTSSRTIANIPIISDPTDESSLQQSTPLSSIHSSRSNSSLGQGSSKSTRSLTMFVSKSAAQQFNLPREPSFVSKQNVALVDLNKLRAGSLFDPEDSDPVTSLSPRFDLLTPANDMEVQDLINKRTTSHLTSSETPSTMLRMMRRHEMLGRLGGQDVTGRHSGQEQTDPTVSPRLGLYNKGNTFISGDDSIVSTSFYIY